MFSKLSIEQYFNAEKQGSIFFIVTGIVALALAVTLFLIYKSNFFKGFAIPLVLIGIIAGSVGLFIYNRSDKDRIRNVYAFDLNPDELKQKEYPRMQQVMKTFKIAIGSEAVLLAAGVFLFFYFRTNETKQFWSGLGAGMVVICIAAMVLDIFAQQRAAVYLKGLEEFVKQMK